MDNNIYITLSRQLAMFRDLSVTANNIANANTTGFNAEHMLFTSYLNKDVNSRDRNPMAFDYDISTWRNTETGAIKTTGNPLDLAISGPGYFAVNTPLGTRYTRAGNLQLDALGTLITADGYQVLNSNNQPIVFPDDTQDIVIGSAGNIAVNGTEFETIGVYSFENEQELKQLGSGQYTTDQTPQLATGARVLQGALENSNVQPVRELTHLIDVSRSTANTAKFIETMYDLQRKSINTWTQQG